MTLRSVQRRSGGFFSTSAVNGYERGQRQISLDRFCYLAELYGASGDELLRRVLGAIGRASPAASTVVRDRAEVLSLFYREVMGRGNLSLIDELCTPDFVDHGTATRFDPRASLESFKTWTQHLHRTFSRVIVSLEDALFVGDQVVVRLKLDLWRRGAEQPHMSVCGSEWVRFEGGRLAERWGIDGAWLLDQAGAVSREAAARSS